MSRDDLLSKKLSDVEEKKKGYLARRVEASDRERVDATHNPSRDEPVDSGASAVPGDDLETDVESRANASDPSSEIVWQVGLNRSHSGSGSGSDSDSDSDNDSDSDSDSEEAYWGRRAVFPGSTAPGASLSERQAAAGELGDQQL